MNAYSRLLQKMTTLWAHSCVSATIDQALSKIKNVFTVRRVYPKSTFSGRPTIFKLKAKLWFEALPVERTLYGAVNTDPDKLETSEGCGWVQSTSSFYLIRAFCCSYGAAQT
jgi:hypothetical protein